MPARRASFPSFTEQLPQPAAQPAVHVLERTRRFGQLEVVHPSSDVPIDTLDNLFHRPLARPACQTLKPMVTTLQRLLRHTDHHQPIRFALVETE